MQRRNLSRPRAKAASVEPAPLNWQYLVLVFLCGAVIAAGFFFAARQHFMSMDYGFKNSRLKKQLEDLEAEKRRLMLAREVSLSPSEIRKASRTVGLRAEESPKPIAIAAVAGNEPTKSTANQAAKTLIAATASVRPLRTSYSELSAANQSDRPTKTNNVAKEKRDLDIAAVAKLR